MPRYEFKQGKSSKFWEIELQDESFTTRWGKIGTEGQEATKDFESRAEAKKAYSKLIVEKTAKGYALLSTKGGDGPPEAKSNEQLERAIFDEPDNDQAFVVYGDWLQSNGDPRGKLVALHAALAERPGDKAIRRQIETLLKKNAEFFYGDAGDWIGSAATVTWRLGFFDTVRLALGRGEAEDKDGYELDLEEVVGTTLDQPSARFLRELRIGLLGYQDVNNEYSGIVRILSKVRPPPPLRSLVIGDFEFPEDTEISWVKVGDIGALWKRFPKLENLTLQGAEIRLGLVEAPTLRSLTLGTGGLPAGALRDLAKAHLPSLERLEIWTGSKEYGGRSTFKDARALLEGKGLPALKHLGLRNCEYTAELMQWLPDSAVLKQLESVDVSMGTLTDDEVNRLIADRAAFSHLETLDLSLNLLGAGAKKLKALGKRVVAGNQRTLGSESRYVAVGE